MPKRATRVGAGNKRKKKAILKLVWYVGTALIKLSVCKELLAFKKRMGGSAMELR